MIRLTMILAAVAVLGGLPAAAQGVRICQEAGAPATVVLAVTWRAQDRREAEVAEILAQLAPASRAEPGVVTFLVHRSPTDARDFFLYEQYRDQQAFDAHFESAHFRSLVLGRAVPLLAQRSRVTLRLADCPPR